MIKSGHIKRSASGVPILSHDQIDGLGEQLAGDFQPDLLTCPQELDIESFIEFYMGLKLDFKFLSSCGKYLGMTVFNDTDKVIFYDPARNNADYMHVGAGTVIIDSTLLTPKKEHRMRFTLGHEGAGHAFLHEDYYTHHSQSNALCANTEGLLLESRDQYHERRTGKWVQRTDEDWMEWQADAMSSATLMPRCSVMKHLKSVEDSEKYASLSDKQKPIYMIDSVMVRYNVSFQAAMMRLRHLGCIPDGYYHANQLTWTLLYDRYEE